MSSSSSDPSRDNARRMVQEMMDTYLYIMKKQNFKGYDIEVMTNLKLIDAEPSGKVTWELFIGEFYGNLNGVMHGGAAGVIFDMATTTALCPISKSGYWDFMGGVTRTLQISYLRAIPINTTVRIHSQCVQHGRTMALIRGTMTSPTNPDLVYATCEHHKVNVPSLKDHLMLRDEMRLLANSREKGKEEEKGKVIEPREIKGEEVGMQNESGKAKL